jgi:hypothetical protein
MSLLSPTVQFQDGSRRTYELNPNSLVSDLLFLIQSDLSRPSSTIRLLYLGRFLSPDQSLSSLSSDSDFTIQCFFQTSAPTPALSAPEIDVRGFDRLARVGYTASQIRDIRDLFHRVNGTQTELLERQLDLEDEWVPAIALAENPLAAIRVIALAASLNAQGNVAEVQTLHPPTVFANESEAPLLQPREEVARPGAKRSWWPFCAGAAWGVVCGKNAFAWIVGCVLSCNMRFALGFLAGIGMRLMIENLMV